MISSLYKLFTKLKYIVGLTVRYYQLFQYYFIQMYANHVTEDCFLSNLKTRHNTPNSWTRTKQIVYNLFDFSFFRMNIIGIYTLILAIYLIHNCYHSYESDRCSLFLENGPTTFQRLFYYVYNCLFSYNCNLFRML